MKKLMFIITFVMVTNLLFAQEENKDQTPPQSKEMSLTILAQQLSNYGYAKNDPLSLLAAAKIISSNPVKEFVPKSTSPEKPKGTASIDPSVMLNPQKMLDDAKKMSNNDPSIVALASQITFPKSKGSPQGIQVIRDFIAPGVTKEYTCVFLANELAEVAVIGDGRADLDLYVYDMNNNLIVRDIRTLTDAYVSFYPNYTTTFTIKVKNVSNTYSCEYVVGVN
jgi:hypothetical protein